MALVYGSNYTALARDLGTSTASVSRWAKGGEISGTFLTRLYGLGLNLNWLADEFDTDSLNMFAENTQGKELRNKHFAAAGSSMQRQMVSR